MNKTMIALLVAALVSPLAIASHGVGRCDGGDNISLGMMEVGGGDPAATFYVDDRNYALGNGIWIYQESNGIYTAGASAHDNLQRGGASPYVPDDAEICTDVGEYDPDTLIL